MALWMDAHLRLMGSDVWVDVGVDRILLRFAAQRNGRIASRDDDAGGSVVPFFVSYVSPTSTHKKKMSDADGEQSGSMTSVRKGDGDCAGEMRQRGVCVPCCLQRIWVLDCLDDSPAWAIHLVDGEDGFRGEPYWDGVFTKTLIA